MNRLKGGKVREAAQAFLNRLQLRLTDRVRHKHRAPRIALSVGDALQLQIMLRDLLSQAAERDDLEDRINTAFEILDAAEGACRTKVGKSLQVLSRPRHLWNKRWWTIDRELLVGHYCMLTEVKGRHSLEVTTRQDGKRVTQRRQVSCPVDSWKALEVLAELHGINSAESALRHLQDIRKKSKAMARAHGTNNFGPLRDSTANEEVLWRFLDYLPSTTAGQRSRRGARRAASKVVRPRRQP